MRIAINGAGIGGPTLAWWLRRAGHEVVLIEEAERLRTGGYIIDFWGVGYDIAEKMGVLPQVLDAGYRVRAVRMVDGEGRERGGFSADIFRRAVGDRFTSLRRSDLSAVIFNAVEGAEVLFGDTVRAFEPAGDGLRIELASGGTRDVDLLVGADGLHSRVRELAFGPEDQFERYLGYYVAAFEAEGYRPRDELTYLTHTTPGREVARFAMREDRTLFLFVFHADRLEGPEPHDLPGRKAALRRVFAGQGWETPRILETLDGADEVYFDRMSQIVMPQWSRGRVALVGDAASSVSLLAGEGSGLAMCQAYVLAGELKATGGDYPAAFARYEARLRPFLEGKQVSARRFASYFAPRTAFGVWVRNAATRLLGLPVIGEALVMSDLRDDVELPAY